MAAFRPGGFMMIPTVIKNLIIVNIIIYLAQSTLGPSFDTRITDLFGLHDVHSVFFRPHQLVTYMFLHGSWPHVLLNMFALWVFGSMLENFWGAKRFLIFYAVCGIGAALAHLAILYGEMSPVMDALHQLSPDQQQEWIYSESFKVNQATVGASGAVFGCLAAMGYLFPNEYIYVNFFLPIKAKWYALGYGAVELFSGIQNSAGDNVAHWAHLGGGLVGLLLVIYWNRTNRRNFY